MERGQEIKDKEIDCLKSLQASLSFSESSGMFRSTCFPAGSPLVQSRFYDIDSEKSLSHKMSLTFHVTLSDAIASFFPSKKSAAAFEI